MGTLKLKTGSSSSTLSQISGFQKQQFIESCELCLTRLWTKLVLEHQTILVLFDLNFNFYLRCNSMQAL